ncbi:MAG TPA: aspartyl protease family protein [Vicinamibacterales bacterium]|nr:aspartyl protease family protein [Vicinamibacterales bacterium]
MLPSAFRPKGVAIVTLLAAGTLTLGAQDQRHSDFDARLREGHELMSQLKYEDAFLAYRDARGSQDARVRVQAGTGAVRAMLKVGYYAEAVRIASEVASRDPENSAALAIDGDALWASSLFPEAEARYEEALKINPNDPVALHGRGRSLAAQRRFSEAIVDVNKALEIDDKQAAYHYTLASIYEDTRDFKSASEALADYLGLIPSRNENDLAKWAETQVEFLRDFGYVTPFEEISRQQSYTMPFREHEGRLLVKGRLNGLVEVEFALDTGTDQTFITPAIARRANVKSKSTLQTAGVGDLGYGFRGLQIAKFDQIDIGPLRMRNVTGVIKSPSLKDLPREEGSGFSPLSLGFSVRVDYAKRQLTMARTLPKWDAPVRVPLRMQRLAIVRGIVNGNTPAGFVLDTGGEATSLSRRVAGTLGMDPELRRVPAQVYGSSGWDRRAFLMPYVDIEFASGVGLQQRSVPVVNLDAPSALLGVNIGGIIGHELLSRYTLTIDLNRAEVGLEPIK